MLTWIKSKNDYRGFHMMEFHYIELYSGIKKSELASYLIYQYEPPHRPCFKSQR